MFGGGSSNEYEEIVNKTTDENLTSENWEMIMNLCDKVQEEGQAGAHAATSAILKRLAHRNPNVQLYALSLAESLSKNLGIEVHREIASRAFTQGLERVVVDRNTHEKVRRRALGLIAMWTAEFEKNTDLGLMEECYNALKAKNYKFEAPDEPPPPAVDDEARRREEEELQRVLEMSMQDRGGRGAYSAAASSGSGGASASASSSGAGASKPGAAAHPFAQPKYGAGGYVPARTPSPSASASAVAAAQQQRAQAAQYHLAQAAYTAAQAQQVQGGPAQGGYPTRSSSLSESTPTPIAAIVSPAPAPASSSSSTSTYTALPTSSTPTQAHSVPPTLSLTTTTRVRALHTFEPSEPGELAFEKGDVIKVVDRGYKDWWRGQLKGRTGIFPVNYVEPLPEPTPLELAREAEAEAAVFAQAANVEKLLAMLRALDPQRDNLADNEEIQELYRSSMVLRPKIVKLIDKYSQKRADLVSMNETFVRARTIFDRMMEESLARHTGVYDQPAYRPPQGPQPQPVQPHYRPDSAGGGRPGHGQQPSYGWNAASAALYEGYTTPTPAAYPGGPGAPANAYGVPVPQVATVPGQPGYVNGAAGPQQALPYGVGAGPYAGGVYASQPQPGPQQQQQQPQQGPVYGAAPQVQPQQQQPQPQPQAGPVYGAAPQQQQAQPYQQSPQQPGQVYPQQQQPPTQAPAQAYPQQQPQQGASSPGGISSLPQAQPQGQSQFEYQQQVQPQPQAATSQLQAQQPQPAQTQPTTVIQPQSQQAQPQQTQSQAAVPPAAQPQPQQQPQTQAQAQPAPQQPISGPPPYVYDPTYTYADPNVQAWAQYYAQGGKDLAGSVYFLSIPGLTDGPTAAAAAASGGGGTGAAAGAAGGAQAQAQAQGQQSAEAQNHAQNQNQNQSELPYGAALNSAAAASSASLGAAVRAASPAVQQQQQRPAVQYQLSDPGPIQQVQAQAQPQYAAYPASSSPNDAIGLKQASPTLASTTPFGGVRPGTSGSYQGSGHSPSSSTSTPAWVLPKKSANPNPSVTPGGGPAAGLASQLGGISLSDQ